MCNEETKPSPVYTKKHHYIPDSPDKGVFSMSPENGHSKLRIYFKTGRHLPGTKVCLLSRWIAMEHTVIASSVKREAACEILLNRGASERLNELNLAGSSWLVPPAHGSASALPSSLLQCWAEAAHLGTRLLLYTGSPTAVFKKAELLSPIARQI